MLPPVSYTHLDVYKRQIMGLYNVEEKEAVKMMADTDKRRMTNYSFYPEQKWGKASNYTLCLNSSQPVSYTHLDVYKRQMQRTLFIYNVK